MDERNVAEPSPDAGASGIYYRSLQVLVLDVLRRSVLLWQALPQRQCIQATLLWPIDPHQATSTVHGGISEPLDCDSSVPHAALRLKWGFGGLKL